MKRVVLLLLIGLFVLNYLYRSRTEGSIYYLEDKSTNFNDHTDSYETKNSEQDKFSQFEDDIDVFGIVNEKENFVFETPFHGDYASFFWQTDQKEEKLLPDDENSVKVTGRISTNKNTENSTEIAYEAGNSTVSKIEVDVNEVSNASIIFLDNELKERIDTMDKKITNLEEKLEELKDLHVLSKESKKEEGMGVNKLRLSEDCPGTESENAVIYLPKYHFKIEVEPDLEQARLDDRVTTKNPFFWRKNAHFRQTGRKETFWNTTSLLIDVNYSTTEKIKHQIQRKLFVIENA
ncbi:hypothetical protein LSTR_LSTR010388 [Laodelphax striatellus]|uniref:Uncharacterized protein n=1 Tax=Laodelphax striatellus TaxID=195883 RepID=A0A482XHW0_LAOST|nr:hypothetical protein LSTR_LSTR010388 [Laodelphax striatellus]